MKRYTLLFSLLVICLFSCEQKDENIKSIKFDLSAKNTTSPSINIKSFVKLETTDSSLIGEITKVDYYLGHYYILDTRYSKALFVFNSKGEFITKTKLGKGPGEVLDPQDFFIDKKNNRILLWSQMNFKMFQFGLNLNHISSDTYNGMSIRNFILTDEGEIFVHAQGPVLNELKNNKEPVFYNYFVYAENLNILSQKFLPAHKNSLALSLESPICQNDDIEFIAPYDNYIYRYKNNIIEPIYRLDFGKYAITESDVEKGTGHIFAKARRGTKIGPFTNLHVSSNFLSISFFYANTMNFFIHSKQKNVNYYSQKLFKDNKLPRCRLKGIVNNSFLAVVQPSDFLKSESRIEILKQLIYKPDIQDNPYLMLFNIVE